MRPRLTSLSLRGERGVLEAALGQAPVQRHLAALEALDAHARARGLALAAAAAGLAGARADAAADALSRLARARPACEFVQFHRRSPHPLVSSSRPLNRRSARTMTRDAIPPPPRRDARPWRSCRGSRRVDKLGDAADLVEPQPDQRLALAMVPALRAAGLPDLDGLARSCPHFIACSRDLSRPPPVRHRRRGGAPAAPKP